MLWKLAKLRGALAEAVPFRRAAPTVPADADGQRVLRQRALLVAEISDAEICMHFGDLSPGR